MNSKRYTLKVMTRTEADIIAKLDSVPNKAGYIKELIRRDMRAHRLQFDRNLIRICRKTVWPMGYPVL